MKRFAARWLVFTDLDGTLLDERYDIRSAGAAMDILHEHGCICIPASSKTHQEMSELNKTRKFPSPYILENGAGLYWPSAATPELLGREVAEHGVVLQQMCQGRRVGGIVDRDEVYARVAHRGAHDIPTDSTEPVDPDSHRHSHPPLARACCAPQPRIVPDAP